MNSHWFKFYGQDWLTDLKIIMLSPVDRLCFITLLCLASTTDDAVIKNCNENALIELTHLYNNPYDDEDNDYNRAKGCLQRFNDNAMITLDNKGNITINNFLKRQGSNLTGYERVKRYREKHKDKPKKDNNVINDNAMITSDKIREDKIRENNIYGTNVPNKSMYNEPIIELDENGEVIEKAGGMKIPRGFIAKIGQYYKKQFNIPETPGLYFGHKPAIEAMIKLAYDIKKGDWNEIEYEIKSRIDKAKDLAKEKKWGKIKLSTILENWNLNKTKELNPDLYE